ncbi:MAG: GNAT family N-acetyltransferase [Halorientalis sp.]
MPGSTFLRGDSVALRAIQEVDIQFLDGVFNDPDVWATLGNHTPISDLDDPGFVEGHVASDDHVSLLVCVGDDGGDSAGFVDLSPATPVDGETEVVLALAPDYWGQGFGTEASRLVTTYAFEERRAHRVTARALADNTASRRIWEKLGFREEGRFREAAFHGGEYRDIVFYGVLDGEWGDD